jgi:hypothetical protein
MLYCNLRHVSNSIMLIFRRLNCIITTSGTVTLCKQLYGTPLESSLLSTGVLYYKSTIHGQKNIKLRVFVYVPDFLTPYSSEFELS